MLGCDHTKKNEILLCRIFWSLTVLFLLAKPHWSFWTFLVLKPWLAEKSYGRQMAIDVRADFSPDFKDLE